MDGVNHKHNNVGRTARGFSKRHSGQIVKGGSISKTDTSPKQPPQSYHHSSNKSNPSSRSEKRNMMIRNEIQDLSPQTSSSNKKSSKKVNMNHLLGVSFSPRHDNKSSTISSSFNSLTPKRRPPINHVRTHCQTLLRKSALTCPSLQEIQLDPNLHIDWCDAIAAVRYFERQECAICLDVPLAPRATRCGHVFCFPCMLHHFSVILDDNIRKSSAWHKCPVCHKEVLKRKLKPARITAWNSSNKKLTRQGDTVQFKLTKRSKNSVFAKTSDEQPILQNNKQLDLAESSFGWIDLELEIELLSEDLEVLNVHKALAEATEVPFFEEAIELINSDISQIKEKIESGEVQGLQGTVFAIDDAEEENESVQYYQASNARMFLHPVNNRCVLDHFGDELPDKIGGTVVDVDTFQIYEDLTKRFKFLSHLPDGTTVHLVELDVKSMYTASSVTENAESTIIKFSPEVLKKIKPAITKRRKLRQKRVQEEHLYEQRILEEDMEKLFLFDETDYYPVNNVGEEDFPGIEPQQDTEQSSSRSGATLAQKMRGPGLSPQPGSSISSFGFAARMRDVNNNTVTSELIGINPRPSTPPSCAQIVYKTKSNKKKSKKKHSHVN